MSDIDKINKMLEAAIVCAAQDGLDDGELPMVAGAMMVVPTMGPAIQKTMAKHDIETDDVDLGFDSAIDAFKDFTANLSTNLGRYELIELDENYAEEVASVLGNSAALQNLCIGIAFACAVGDGEISDLERNAIQLLGSKMDLLVMDIAKMVGEQVIKAYHEQS